MLCRWKIPFTPAYSRTRQGEPWRT